MSCAEKETTVFYAYNCKKFKYVLITFGTNHPETPFYYFFTKILENFAHVLTYHYVVLT